MDFDYSTIPPFSLLFFRGNSIFSRIISRFSRFSGQSKKQTPSHVEVVLPGEIYAEFLRKRFGSPPSKVPHLVCFAATTMAETQDLVLGIRMKGVQWFDLQQRVGLYTGQNIWVRRYRGGPLSDSTRQKLIAFCAEEWGKPYEKHPTSLVGSVLNLPLVDRLFETDGDDSRFCSELTVQLMRTIHAFLPPEQVPFRDYINGAEEYSPNHLFRMPFESYGEVKQCRG